MTAAGTLAPASVAVLVACLFSGFVGYRLHTCPECPAATVTQRTEQQDLTARRITSVVTKYVTVPGKAPEPTEVTKTIIEQPKAHTNVSSSVSVTPAVSTLTRYSLGVGCVALPCTRFSSVELQGSVRLGDLPLHVYTSFQPSTTRLSVGLRYEF